MRSGIYFIENAETGQRYYGSSNDVARRFRNHKSQLRRGKHHNDHLQRAWNKYGELAFIFAFFWPVEKDLLLEAEQSLAAYIKPDDYNIRLIAESNYGLSGCRGEANKRAILSVDDVIKIRERLLYGDLQKDIAKDYGVSDKAINAIRLGQSWQHIQEFRNEVARMPCSKGTRNNSGPNNPRSKINVDDAKEIINLLDGGETLQAVGDRYDVPKQTIWKIKHGLHWTNAELPR